MVIRGTTGGKCYQLLPEKGNADKGLSEGQKMGGNREFHICRMVVV